MEKFKPYYLISVLAVGVLFLIALNFTNQFNPFAALSPGSLTKVPKPLFSSLDQFVFAAQDKIILENNNQVSSGDLSSNQEIRIRQNNIINGNLFSNQIRIESTSTINGNVSFNNLQTEPTVKILGTTSTPISLSIIKLPAIPNFPTGNQRLLINQDQSLSPGTFDEIEIQENTRLTLNLGIYNLNKLRLRNNSQLLFSGKTIINIKQELNIGEKVLIVANKNNITSTDLQISVQQDENPTKSRQRDYGASINIGKDSLLSFKLLAPNSQVNLGERTTFRGQILAKEIKVGENSILSRQDFFSKESDPAKVVIDTDGSQFLVNEIVVNFTNAATLNDAQAVADSINGRIIGFVKSSNAYQIEVIAATPQGLEAKIQTIRQSNNPLIEGVMRNYLLNI